MEAVLAESPDDPARVAAERIGYARVTASFRTEIEALVSAAENRSGRVADKAADLNCGHSAPFAAVRSENAPR